MRTHTGTVCSDDLLSLFTVCSIKYYKHAMNGVFCQSTMFAYGDVCFGQLL
uniref:Uncharacterized protein n=1 Tax=viral metagenome TaxID=1070528 RepID=A0A6C0M064_9ZZZZ